MNIILADSASCVGCASCAQSCPKSAIVMKADAEGFIYPQINEQRCIKCHKCESACPIFHKTDSRIPLHTYAAAINDSRRLYSSSGGIFYLLSKHILDMGGVVFGAMFDKDWNVIISSTDTLTGLMTFQGSKYVQSKTLDSFSNCEAYLKEGRYVLYSGTPCQISALKTFLKRSYENLTTVDFVCHGVPSPKVWSNYIKELQQKGKIQGINFRDKTNGWINYSFSVSYLNNMDIWTESSEHHKNPYMRAFLSNIMLRSSCYSCQFKSGKSQSDVTLGDWWGIWDVNEQLFDDKGTSLVMDFSRDKISQLLNGNEYLTIAETNYKDACKWNPSIIESVPRNPLRNKFFKEIRRGKDIETAINNISANKGFIFSRIYSRLGKILKTIVKRHIWRSA